MTEAIIIAVISAVAVIIAAGIGFAVSTYQARHDDSGIKAGYTEKITFKKTSGNKSATFSAKPYTGTLYCDLLQKTGKKGTKYSAKWKLSTKPSYNFINTFKVSKNNKWIKEKKCGSVKKGKKYNFCITKTNNLSTQSKIEMDWLLK